MRFSIEPDEGVPPHPTLSHEWEREKRVEPANDADEGDPLTVPSRTYPPIVTPTKVGVQLHSLRHVWTPPAVFLSLPLVGRDV